MSLDSIFSVGNELDRLANQFQCLGDLLIFQNEFSQASIDVAGEIIVEKADELRSVIHELQALRSKYEPPSASQQSVPTQGD